MHRILENLNLQDKKQCGNTPRIREVEDIIIYHLIELSLKKIPRGIVKLSSETSSTGHDRGCWHKKPSGSYIKSRWQMTFKKKIRIKLNSASNTQNC